MAGVKAVVRLLVPAGSAKPGPAIGQALGPHGLNMVEFCKAFNAATEKVSAPRVWPGHVWWIGAERHEERALPNERALGAHLHRWCPTCPPQSS
jgi:hypothetical protein